MDSVYPNDEKDIGLGPRQMDFAINGYTIISVPGLEHPEERTQTRALIEEELVFALGDRKAFNPWEGVPTPDAHHSTTIRAVRHKAFSSIGTIGVEFTEYNKAEMLTGPPVYLRGIGGGSGLRRRSTPGTTEEHTVLTGFVNLGTRNEDVVLVPRSHFLNEGFVDSGFSPDQLDEIDRGKVTVSVPQGSMIVYFRNMIHSENIPTCHAAEICIRLYVGLCLSNNSPSIQDQDTLTRNLKNWKSMDTLVGPPSHLIPPGTSEEDKNTFFEEMVPDMFEKMEDMRRMDDHAAYPAYSQGERSWFFPIDF